MENIPVFVFQIFVFLSVYVQVFLFVTFLENRGGLTVRRGGTVLSKYPFVTVIVPAYNEERTIYKTVRSLLGINYPKEKLKIFLVDDGSTDGTWRALCRFSHYSNIKLFRKENGGKHTALNLGLEHTETEFFGCLDADSIAHPESLVRIMSYFEEDASLMAVAPSVTIYNPKNFIQNIQTVEYYMGVYMKKMFGFMGAINVTPGPLTIFRKKVFDDLGPYRHAHNTEDMEIAYRMQKNYYKIGHCHDAYVYTNAPNTIRKLYKQRLRWIYGFINNVIDYRKIIFSKKYGNFAFFTIPASIASLIAVSFLFGKIVYGVGSFLFSKIMQFQLTGFHIGSKGIFPDLFFINTQTVLFIPFVSYFLIILAITLGTKMAEGKWRFSFNTVYFLLIFSLVSPFWVMKSIFNTILKRKPAWR